VTDMLIQEVNNDLRAERMHALWRRVRMPLLLAAALLIAVTAGTSVYKHFDHQKKAEATQLLLRGAEAYGRKDYPSAIAAFAQTRNQIGGELGGIAQLWQARSLMAQNDSKAAARLLRAMVAEVSVHPRIRDMACVHMASLSHGSLPAQCDGAAVSPLHSSLLLLHAASLWKNGKHDEAAAAFKKLSVDAGLAQEERALAKRYLTTIQASHAP